MLEPRYLPFNMKVNSLRKPMPIELIGTQAYDPPSVKEMETSWMTPFVVFLISLPSL